MSEIKQLAFERGLVAEDNVLLGPMTNWKIGGPARWLIRTKNSKQTADALALAKISRLPHAVLGGGTNVLVSDAGFNGVVIKIESNSVDINGRVAWADAGVAMGRLAALTMQKNLAGLEWAVGIPGTVGGAVFGNSNCFGGSTARNFAGGEIVNADGELVVKPPSYFEFSYDYSGLQKSNEILTRAAFELTQVGSAAMTEIREHISRVAAERAVAQPLGEKTAGSTFKALSATEETVEKIKKIYPDWQKGLRDNLISAGFIIDRCLGLKGYTLGRMKVSDKHANFFVNLGDATAQNAKALIDFVKRQSLQKTGLTLEEEIKYIGNFNNNQMR